MPNKRITMRKIREILRLRFEIELSFCKIVVQVYYFLSARTLRATARQHPYAWPDLGLYFPDGPACE